jgi:regulation of enolase protein 1 (concanavalin A-like superfamily)
MTPARSITWLVAGIIFLIAFAFLRSVVGPLVAAWRLGPKGQERPTGVVPGVGDAFDPRGDCSIKGDGKLLTIGVPGSLHDLCVERAQVDAPRVLREVQGDFVAEVTVAGAIAPGGAAITNYALPHHGAGLLIWSDRDHYIRLERAAILRDNNVFHYVNFEQRQAADLASSFGQGTPDGLLTLRLERRGSRISASYRVEGVDWVRLSREMSIGRWGPTLMVGVVAVDVSGAPLTAELQDFRVGPNPDPGAPR